MEKKVFVPSLAIGTYNLWCTKEQIPKVELIIMFMGNQCIGNFMEDEFAKARGINIQ